MDGKLWKQVRIDLIVDLNSSPGRDTAALALVRQETHAQCLAGIPVQPNPYASLAAL